LVLRVSTAHVLRYFSCLLVAPSTPSWQTQATREMHVPQYAVVAAGVGSAVIVLLLAIVIVLTVTAVVTSCKKKGERHFWII